MFSRIHHVAVVVRSLDGALGVFADVLGLPVGIRATVSDQGVHAALLPMADGEIELLEPADTAGGVARFLDRRGEGLHHVCLETPDVSGALAAFQTAAIPVIDQAPRPGLAGMIAFLHPKANHGVLVELAQPSASTTHHGPSTAGVQAMGIGTVYLAVKELGPAAATFTRNFGGRMGAAREPPVFQAQKVAVSIGSSRITLLSSTDPGSPVGRFLNDRGEGLYGVCLLVRDFRRALQYLNGAGLSVSTMPKGEGEPLACLEPHRLHGINLFLCPSQATGAS
jgi:methylmalonyl-CoA/ethylmalonyl-CoA epimerase